MMTPAERLERDERQLAYRVRLLPIQYDRACRRKAQLEREAARLGLTLP